MDDHEREFSLKRYFTPLTTLKGIHFIIIIGLIVFLNTLFNGFVLEDRAEIVRNPSVHSVTNIPNIFLHQVGGQETITYYRPLLFTVYTLLYALFQENTFPYHAVQIFFHIGNAILLFLIFKKFLRNTIAFFLALIFLVHPINEETVAWITNMQEVLFLFFGLLSVYLLQRTKAGYKTIIAASLCLFLSLLSKETGILFFVIALLSVFLWKRSVVAFHVLCSCIAGVLYVLLRLTAYISLQKEALVPIMKLTFWERMTNVPAIIFYYIKTFFFPKDLVVYHSWVIQRIRIDTFFLPLFMDNLFFLILVLMCILIIKKTKKPAIVLFFSLWFVLGLAFHLQIFPLDFTVADHFFNFPLIGLLGFLGLFFQSFTFNKAMVRICGILATLILIVFSLRTIVRNTNWESQTAILSHDERVSPNDYLLELVESTDLLQNNRQRVAFPHIQKAISLFPQSSRAWTALGVYYYDQKDIPRAKEAFFHALAIDNFFGAYENLGLLLKEHDTPIHARDFLRKATRLYPNSEKLWYYRFIVEYKMGNYDEALLSAKYYYFLKRDALSYSIYQHVLMKLPIAIQ